MTAPRNPPTGRKKQAEPGAALAQPDPRKASSPSPAQFGGFPAAALDFYDDLEADNSKVFWEAHQQTYRDAIRAPMAALTEALEAEFGRAAIFRPYRDVRFSHDKRPYKTHQGAFVGIAPATGWYVEIGAPGVRVAGGFYRASPAGIATVRAAIDGPDGVGLERIVATLRRAGWQVGGDCVKTVPRGYSADHPRIGLLRHKSLTVSRDYGFGSTIHGPELLTAVRKDWRSVRPLVEWLAARLAGTGDVR